MVKKIVILIIALVVIGAIVYAIDGYQKANPIDDTITEGTSTSEIEQDLRMELESSDQEFIQLESEINQL